MKDLSSTATNNNDKPKDPPDPRKEDSAENLYDEVVCREYYQVVAKKNVEQLKNYTIFFQNSSFRYIA